MTITQAKFQELLIKQAYPQSYKATQGVKVGDVIISHMNVPPILLTESILERFDDHNHYFVIANVGNDYELVTRCKR